MVITAPFSLFFVLRRIPEYERAVVLGSTLDMVSYARIGIQLILTMYQACMRGPGLIFVLPFLEKVLVSSQYHLTNILPSTPDLLY